jgi:hypothetical protein
VPPVRADNLARLPDAAHAAPGTYAQPSCHGETVVA